MKSTIKILLLVLLAGCGVGVREDRTIEFSSDGGQVAFQHGQDGIYVANSNGEGLTKIFQPEENVLATSRPLACPTDGRLIFATACSIQNDALAPNGASGNRVGAYPAEGKLVWQQPIKYTCWLRSAAESGEQPVVKKLFEVKCDHLGYIAAGLAVRWHPDGKHILYCAAIDEGLEQHSIFEFDIATEESKRVFPKSAGAILFDWTPAGSHLVCVLTDHQKNYQSQNAPLAGVNRNAGIWVGKADDENSWWQVQGSELLAGPEHRAPIELLRASRPVWSQDDAHFAFVSQKTLKTNSSTAHSVLQRVELASRTSSILYEASGTFSDLHWSPNGKQIGFLHRTDDQPNSLYIIDSDSQIATVPTSNSVRKFVGFDSSGRRIGYVVGNREEQLEDTKCLATLLIPSPLRDIVRIAPADASNEGKEIFSGMQVTFPRWSPTEETMSLWLTFVPRRQSLFSLYAKMGLWPGDPAATVDLRTNAIGWMAVSPEEEIQVGHYHLMKGDAKEAWRWYEQARKKMSSPKPPKNWQDFAQHLGAPKNSQLFEFLCLKRLGRDSEAADKWSEFESFFFPYIQPEEPSSNPDFWSFLGLQSDLFKPLLHDLFIAEVFLSVDGLTEALEHFSKRSDAESDAEALSRSVVLGQLMLINSDYPAYLKHCTELVAPLALKLFQADQKGSNQSESTSQFIVGMSLAPLFREDFFKQLPREAAADTIVRWGKLAPLDNPGLPSVAINLVLRAAAKRTEDVATSELAQERIAANPDSQPIFSGKPIDDAIESLFHSLELSELRNSKERL